MVAYFDTSALVKLVVDEKESAALRAWISPDDVAVSSALSRAELARAVRRTVPQLMPRVKAVLDRLTLILITPQLLDEAGRLQASELRTLDALHLATALHLGDELDTFVAYDHRLSAAATLHGLDVAAPA